MKSKKDISESIRENAHKLEERPSKDAWARLESRLDQQEQIKPRFFSRRLLSIAAASIALLCCLTVISFMFKNQNAKTASNDYMAEPEVFIVEELNAPSEEEQGFYKIVEFQNKHQSRLSNPIAEGSRKKLSVSKSRQSYEDDGSIAIAGYPANDASNPAFKNTIQSLDWMLGKWKGKKETVEQWRKANDQTLDGVGYIMADGKPTFTEVMKIQEVSGNLYYIVDPTGSGQMIRYSLIMNDGQQLIFENTTMVYPQQVIIRQNEVNQLGIYYRNLDSRRPGISQENHLNKRNNKMKGGQYGRVLIK